MIIFSFESNQINLDLLSNDAKFLQISEICCIASVLYTYQSTDAIRKWHLYIHISRLMQSENGHIIAVLHISKPW